MNAEDFFAGKRVRAIDRAIRRGGLAAARARRGLTGTDLAERLGVTTAAVSFWESGKSRPRLAMARRIAAVLEVSTGELVTIFKGCTPCSEGWQ